MFAPAERFLLSSLSDRFRPSAGVHRGRGPQSSKQQQTMKATPRTRNRRVNARDAEPRTAFAAPPSLLYRCCCRRHCCCALASYATRQLRAAARTARALRWQTQRRLSAERLLLLKGTTMKRKRRRTVAQSPSWHLHRLRQQHLQQQREHEQPQRQERQEQGRLQRGGQQARLEGIRLQLAFQGRLCRTQVLCATRCTR